MPRYDFKCPQCGNVFEGVCSMHSINAHCPVCGMGSTRIYGNQFGVIVRPAGYRMSPDEPDYFSSIPADHAHHSWQDNMRKER